MNCRHVDPDSGATHEEIIDDLSSELSRAVASLDRSRKRNASLHRQLDTVKGENTPLRMWIAIKIMRAWNSGNAGFDGDVVVTVNEWIDGGMKGPIPFPQSPFFAEWASKNGLSNIDGKVGFIAAATVLASDKRSQ